MALNLSAVTLGIDQETGLIKKRAFTGRLETTSNSIKTYYYQWLETEIGAKVNLITTFYETVDIPAIPEIPAVFDDDGVTVITPLIPAVPANLRFTKWVNQLGNPIIIPAINSTLLTLP